VRENKEGQQLAKPAVRGGEGGKVVTIYCKLVCARNWRSAWAVCAGQGDPLAAKGRARGRHRMCVCAYVWRVRICVYSPLTLASHTEMEMKMEGKVRDFCQAERRRADESRAVTSQIDSFLLY
jgi:hypothetical protein